MSGINTSLIGQLPYMKQEDNSYIPQSFMHAYSIAKEQNDPLHKLRTAALDQEMQMKSFELSKALEDRQKTIESEKRAREIAPTISGLLASGKPYDAQMAILSETAKNPDLQFAPTWVGLGKSVGAAVTYQDKLEDNRRQMARDAEYQTHNMTMEDIAQQRVDALTDKSSIGTGATEVRTDDGELLGYQVQGANGPQFIKKESAESLSAGDKIKLQGLHSELRDIDKELRKHPPIEVRTGLMGNPNADDANEMKLREDLVNQKASVQRKINALSAPKTANAMKQVQPKTAPAAAPAKAPELKLGGTYKDANGRKAIYKGGDPTDPASWQEVE